jgi:hypothetical protein
MHHQNPRANTYFLCMSYFLTSSMLWRLPAWLRAYTGQSREWRILSAKYL